MTNPGETPSGAETEPTESIDQMVERVNAASEEAQRNGLPPHKLLDQRTEIVRAQQRAAEHNSHD
jgi:hypothetical protein